MNNPPRRADINISSIPVSGVGGLAFVVIAVVMAAVLPLARWVLLLGAAGGALLGAAKILVRRYHGRSSAGGDGPGELLHDALSAAPEKRSVANEPHDTAIRRLAVAG